MTKRKLTDEQIKEICELYQKNILTPELGKMFSVSDDTIIKYLKKNGIFPSIKIKINIGDKFNRWTIIGEVKDRGIDRSFVCECSCPLKTRKSVLLKCLRDGESKSCGCLKKELVIKRRTNSGKNYIGQIFGKLTVLYEVERSKFGKRQMMAQCSCDGNIGKYGIEALKKGNTTSCGCYNKEIITFRTKDYQEKYPLFCKVEEIIDDPNGYGILTKCKKCDKLFSPDPS